MNYNSKLVEAFKIVEGLHAVAPSSTTPDYVSLKNAIRLTIIINVKNTTAVTGSAITLKQATAVAGTSEKALAFSVVHANTDTGAADTLTETTVSSNTFTTANTNSKNLMYVIDVDPSSLDVANSFDCVRLGTGDATNATVTANYIIHTRYPKATPPAAITD